jgi:copper chaperone CopZ
MQHITDCRVDPAAPRAAPGELEGADSIHLSVVGMGCPNCANRIRNALLARGGVVDVTIDLPAALARVWYAAAEVTPAEMVAVVRDAGEGSHHQYLAVPVRDVP